MRPGQKCAKAGAILKESGLRAASACIGSPSEDQGHGLNDLANFQLYFATQATTIIVYASSEFGRGSIPLYNGSNLVMEKSC